jgi:hypothetical protein
VKWTFLSITFGVFAIPPFKAVKKKATKGKLMDAILDIQNQNHRLSPKSFDRLKASIENLTAIVQGDQYELETIAMSSLNIGDVEAMLKLNHSLDSHEF